ncbi:peptidyl-prolyl cis-trans isomerase CYP7 [[Candida] anglica]
MKIETVRPNAYLDVSIDGTPTGRIVVELYDDLAPKTTENFRSLIAAGSYNGNVFHRVVKNFVIQAGDTVYGMMKEGKDSEYPPPAAVGTGNVSSFADGAPFEDENMTALDGPFILCMANTGPNTNGSQFFITTYPQPHLTGKHTVFGHVVHGKSVVRAVERVDTDGTTNLPRQPVRIDEAGEWQLGMPVPVFNASYDQIGGDVYEEHPDDDTHIDHESSSSVHEAATIIKGSGTLLFKAGRKQEALLKYIKCLRYVMEFFPDEDQEPDWYAKYVDLKAKLYLNLALVSLQLGNPKRAVDYSTFLLEMDEKPLPGPADRAKAHFRKGTGLIELKKYKEAVAELRKASELVEGDKAIERELERATAKFEQSKKDEKARYANFFK